MGVLCDFRVFPISRCWFAREQSVMHLLSLKTRLLLPFWKGGAVVYCVVDWPCKLVTRHDTVWQGVTRCGRVWQCRRLTRHVWQVVTMSTGQACVTRCDNTDQARCDTVYNMWLCWLPERVKVTKCDKVCHVGVQLTGQARSSSGRRSLVLPWWTRHPCLPPR